MTKNDFCDMMNEEAEDSKVLKVLAKYINKRVMDCDIEEIETDKSLSDVYKEMEKRASKKTQGNIGVIDPDEAVDIAFEIFNINISQKVEFNIMDLL